jgi:hypothetical protein
MDTEANQISHRLHQVPWNSTSELFEELEKVLNGVLSSPNASKLTVQLRDELNMYIQFLADG